MSKLLPMLDPFNEIRKLYFGTTRETIDRDLARALDLLTRMANDDDRQRVAGFMHGLSELKRDWKKPKKKSAPKKKAVAAKKKPAAKKKAVAKKKPARRKS